MKERPNTTKNNVRGINQTPSMQTLNRQTNNNALAQVCFRCFVIYSNILAIYDDDSGLSAATLK